VSGLLQYEPMSPSQHDTTSPSGPATTSAAPSSHADTTSPAPLGLIVHPTRNVDEPRRAVLDWARANHTEVVELPLEAGETGHGDGAGRCSLIVTIGGDGTALAAIRRAATCGRPVLGVACGSLGALTSVPADEVARALERFQAGEWAPRELSALRIETGNGDSLRAFNDIALVREGGSQLRVSARVDGALYVRVAGDGCIVSTAGGSSAYTIAAGGPLLDPRLAAFILTCLPTHGGFSPPLVMTAESRLELEVSAGHAGARLEVDGRVGMELPEKLTVSLECAAATVVTFDDQESHLHGLRRRGIITDSPRILADDARG
jgi:NAD+ kinase